MAEGRQIIFVGNGRDFHAIDWYRTIRKVCPTRRVYFATDLIDSEGNAKLLTGQDSVINLYNIDRFLFTNQSTLGNVWRNIVKLCFFPIQVSRLNEIYEANPDSVYHAHTMYYMFICWIAGISFIGSPQGGEISIRPHSSRLYRYFAVKSLQAAKTIVVDSTSLQRGIGELAGRNAVVIQYGIDVSSIQQTQTGERTKIVSIRALYPIYRIEKIFDSRALSPNMRPLVLFYPYWEDGYRELIAKRLDVNDKDLGRLPTKSEVFKLLGETLLAISIPAIDSSPRSVYEAIFCGCCVATTYNPWLEDVPQCMRARVVVVDLQDDLWLEKAINHAGSVVKNPYRPSEAALDLFDQDRSMTTVARLYYS